MRSRLAFLVLWPSDSSSSTSKSDEMKSSGERDSRCLFRPWSVAVEDAAVVVSAGRLNGGRGGLDETRSITCGAMAAGGLMFPAAVVQGRGQRGCHAMPCLVALQSARQRLSVAGVIRCSGLRSHHIARLGGRRDQSFAQSRQIT